jgi:hypothetical protein
MYFITFLEHIVATVTLVDIVSTVTSDHIVDRFALLHQYHWIALLQ